MDEGDWDDKDEEDGRSILQRRASLVATALAGLTLMACGEEHKASPAPGPCLSVATRTSSNPQPSTTASTVVIASANPSATAGASGSATAVGSALEKLFNGSQPQACLTMTPPMPKTR